MGKMDEIILVAPRARVFQNETLAFNGVNSEEKTISTIMKEIEEHFEQMRRGDAEENPDFKQPIPYVVIKREDEVYVYERLQGGERLAYIISYLLVLGAYEFHRRKKLC